MVQFGYLCKPYCNRQCNGPNIYHNPILSCGNQSHSICIVWD